MHIVDLL